MVKLKGNLENVLVKKGKRSPYERIFKKIPERVKYLHTYGENAVVQTNNDIQSKLSNRGKIYIYVENPFNHVKEVCQFLSF
jgi:hypothetical protein